MFHAATVPMSHVGPLRSGITSYVLRRFELELFLKTIDQYHITDVTLVPPVVIAIIKYPQIRNYSLKSLKAVIAGAAPLGKENQSALQVILGPEAKVTQVWGMTEASCIATAFRYPEADETGSVGRPLPNIDSKLVKYQGTISYSAQANHEQDHRRRRPGYHRLRHPRRDVLTRSDHHFTVFQQPQCHR